MERRSPGSNLPAGESPAAESSTGFAKNGLRFGTLLPPWTALFKLAVISRVNVVASQGAAGPLRVTAAYWNDSILRSPRLFVKHVLVAKLTSIACESN